MLNITQNRRGKVPCKFRDVLKFRIGSANNPLRGACMVSQIFRTDTTNLGIVPCCGEHALRFLSKGSLKQQ